MNKTKKLIIGLMLLSENMLLINPCLIKANMQDHSLVINHTFENKQFIEITENDVDFDVVTQTIKSYHPSVYAPNIIIPAQLHGIEVKAIGRNAFYNKQLESITLPNTLKTISKNAFTRNNLKNVTIPNGVERIESFAFTLNEKLTNVILPQTLQTLGECVFSETQLTSLDIPKNAYVSFVGSNRIQTKLEKSDKYFINLKKVNPDINLESITIKQFGTHFDKVTGIVSFDQKPTGLRYTYSSNTIYKTVNFLVVLDFS